ncbi:MAG: transposase, partial [Cytophagaceae bacterium]|nr:transposase [Cytophagaceae bacterium]MDW8457436.1 transposase [Cytophagaceae bacterium]
LQKFFPHEYRQLFSIAYFRLVYQSAIRQMPVYYHHSYLKEYFGSLSLTDKHISGVLQKVGQDRGAIVNMMKQFIKHDDMVLLDMTDVISHSKKMDLPHKGYNRRMDFHSQMNLLFIFSLRQQLPAYYRLVPGNIKDVKAFSLSIKESGLEKVVLIADKGFYSRSNIEMLDQEGISYIIPLRRNSPLIDYTPTRTVSKKNWHGYFKYQQRYIWYYTITIEKRKLHLFLDEELRLEEMRDYLNRIEKFPDEYSAEMFEEKQFEFGTIAILAQIENNSAKEVFIHYKSRSNIEVMFDAYKNILEADRTYMQNEHTLEGWLFVNYLAMQWYYLIYNKLKQTNLIKNHSVQSLLTQIRQIKKIYIDDKSAITEYTKATQTLIDKLKIPIT